MGVMATNTTERQHEHVRKVAGASAAGTLVKTAPMTINTLNALGYVHDRDGRATVRTVKAALDEMTQHSHALSNVHYHLALLKGMGLVDGGSGGGRLRPAVRRALVEPVDGVAD